MSVLSLDLSTHTGFSILEKEKNKIKLIEYGLIEPDCRIDGYKNSYPYNYVSFTNDFILKILDVIKGFEYDLLVIEETNKGKNRYTQKQLEFLHLTLITKHLKIKPSIPIFYLNTSEWRKVLAIRLSKEDKLNNSKINTAKKNKKNKLDLGLKGKVTNKHLAVRYVNTTYNLNLKQKDNDIADSICIGTAYLFGAKVCEGKK